MGALVWNQPVNHFDVSNVRRLASTFDGAKAFNQPLDSWDVSSVVDEVLGGGNIGKGMTICFMRQKRFAKT